MIHSLPIANRGEIVSSFIRTSQILPGTGRGAMRSMVAGHGRRGARPGVPLHHRLWRWSPSRVGRGLKETP